MVMKKICFISITLLALMIFFVGCTGGVTNSSYNEIKVKNTINGYFSALNAQNWNKAKNYCIYKGELYNNVLEWETFVKNNSYCNDVKIEFVITILSANMAIVGDPSEYCVQCVLTNNSFACGKYEDQEPAHLIYLHLEKFGDTYKLSFAHD